MNSEKDTIHADINHIVCEIGTAESDVIPILHAIQKKYNYLPETALRRVCEITDITPASITGVSTFYTHFRHSPVGKHLIYICSGTACHVKGSELVYDAFYRELRIEENQDTDPEGLFTLQRVACLGCCMLAPVVQIDDVTYGHVKTNGVSNILQDFLLYQGRKAEEKTSPRQYAKDVGEIRIGLDSCCVVSGSKKVQQELEKNLIETGIRTQVKQVGCKGMCYLDPFLEVEPPNQEPVLYCNVQPEEVKQILLKHYKPQSYKKRLTNTTTGLLEKILYNNYSHDLTHHSTDTRDSHIDIFLGKQIRIATEHSGQIDPLDIQEYLSHNGFDALKQCLKEYTPETIIDTIKSSGLRGRGGAGFPTGEKWHITRQVNSEKKYLICNGDEGDPGAFMDRMILESFPFRVIEGMIIAAFAVGAHEGFIYIRAEYPLAVERVRNALSRCEKAGILGENILGSSYSLTLKIVEGAGAFVCGEETALIASIEGRRGMPSFRPPYPAQKGLWGYPTLVSNCETFAMVPWIMRNGAQPFSKLGTDRSKGTKVFSLAGKIRRGGLIEVPMGTTIREIVEEIGGGIEDGKAFKAVQIGGPSGGCIPVELADTRVDYEDLTNAGAMMGSGGLLVMDENDCMVDIARYFLTFTCDQSCGKCTYCRIGNHHMLTILEKICSGKGTHADLEKLEEIAHKTKQGSLCGLGKTAPNPVLTTLKYFREEYEAHLNGICPAKRCLDLISYSIDDSCIGCTICAQNCPVKAIPITPYEKHTIDQDLCTKCGTCKQVCPTESVVISSP